MVVIRCPCPHVRSAPYCCARAQCRCASVVVLVLGTERWRTFWCRLWPASYVAPAPIFVLASAHIVCCTSGRRRGKLFFALLASAQPLRAFSIALMGNAQPLGASFLRSRHGAQHWRAFSIASVLHYVTCFASCDAPDRMHALLT